MGVIYLKGLIKEVKMNYEYLGMVMAFKDGNSSKVV